MDDFIKHFASQLLDEDSSGLKPDTVFRDLDDWDSLTAMAVITMIQDEYNVKIDASDFKKLVTIEDLYQYIEKNK